MIYEAYMLDDGGRPLSRLGSWEQAGVLTLSLGCGVLLHYRPELRDVVIGFGAALATIGIHLAPMSYKG